jgi:hypothetical protein
VVTQPVKHATGSCMAWTLSLLLGEFFEAEFALSLAQGCVLSTRVSEPTRESWRRCECDDGPGVALCSHRMTVHDRLRLSPHHRRTSMTFLSCSIGWCGLGDLVLVAVLMCTSDGGAVKVLLRGQRPRSIMDLVFMVFRRLDRSRRADTPYVRLTVFCPVC